MVAQGPSRSSLASVAWAQAWVCVSGFWRSLSFTQAVALHLPTIAELRLPPELGQALLDELRERSWLDFASLSKLQHSGLLQARRACHCFAPRTRSRNCSNCIWPCLDACTA
eukprot:6207253-Pleurochrysis_carterae.AAC.1